MEEVSINNYQDAVDFLRRIEFENRIIKILNEDINNGSVNWKDVEAMEGDIRKWLDTVYNNFIFTNQTELFCKALRISIECFILHNIHDDIMPFITNQFQYEDNIIFQQSKKLNDKGITPQQLGASSKYVIPLTASIVELASLDSHKTILEKANCLCTSFDFLFAELKMAMVEVIAESSDEFDIPVINTEEVIPLLIFVIVKAKLQHFFSNMYYIGAFTDFITENKNISEVLMTFQTAVQYIIDLSEDLPSGTNLYGDLDLPRYNSITLNLEANPEQNTLYKYQMRRLTRLISASHEDINK